ncbi:hypothetical protein [Virgibacillus sp. CBA3643]|uniref:hypothetical protein n=1 Tax=Virgibacillus sp. CBA3643 TaxID=2942278 RepID=UPI0035A38ADB
MEELLEKLDERMNRQEKLMEQLINMVGKNNEATFAMDNRFNNIENRLDKMDDRFDKVENRLDKIENRLDKMDDRFNKIEDDQRVMGEGIQEINGKVDRIELTLDERKYDVQALNKRIFKTESEMERFG